MTVMSTQSLILLLTISLLFYLTADTVSVCRCVICTLIGSYLQFAILWSFHQAQLFLFSEIKNNNKYSTDL